MKILLTGKSGQVGFELARSLQGLGEVVAVDRRQMDLANLDQVRSVIRAVKPDLIVNPAAYTAVDRAESEPEIAMLINGEAPGVIAEEAKKIGAAMIHFSTDYVFDGASARPYLENDATGPINVYGKTKLAGEDAIRSVGVAHLIFRTSWVYGTHGKNFLLTMLRLAREREELRVVADQIGSPTWSGTIAESTAAVLGKAQNFPSLAAFFLEFSGIYHLTSQGQTTWHGFTKAILDSAVPHKKILLTPIATQDYPLPAPRPAYSRMSGQKFISCFFDLPTWENALASCLQKSDILKSL